MLHECLKFSPTILNRAVMLKTIRKESNYLHLCGEAQRQKGVSDKKNFG